MFGDQLPLLGLFGGETSASCRIPGGTVVSSSTHWGWAKRSLITGGGNHPETSGVISTLLLNLGGGNSNTFYFHPDPWGNDRI